MPIPIIGETKKTEIVPICEWRIKLHPVEIGKRVIHLDNVEVGILTLQGDDEVKMSFTNPIALQLFQIQMVWASEVIAQQVEEEHLLTAGGIENNPIAVADYQSKVDTAIKTILGLEVKIDG